MSDSIKNNVINLSNKEPFDNSDNLSSEEKKDKVISYLKELIDVNRTVSLIKSI